MIPNRGGNKARIRSTHPALYRSIMTLSIMSVLLGLNFWYSNPAFNPYGIPKNVVGVVFFLLGISQFVFLNVFRELWMVRLLLAVSFGVMMVWGIANTQQAFAGQTSFQLPILYGALAAFQFWLLVEAPVNPRTQKR